MQNNAVSIKAVKTVTKTQLFHFPRVNFGKQNVQKRDTNEVDMWHAFWSDFEDLFLQFLGPQDTENEQK